MNSKPDLESGTAWTLRRRHSLVYIALANTIRSLHQSTRLAQELFRLLAVLVDNQWSLRNQ